MKTPMDQIQVGQYVVNMPIRRDQPVQASPFGMFVSYEGCDESFSDQPWRIAGVELPLAVISDGRRAFLIDLRRYRMRVVSKALADAYGKGNDDDE